MWSNRQSTFKFWLWLSNSYICRTYCWLCSCFSLNGQCICGCRIWCVCSCSIPGRIGKIVHAGKTWSEGSTCSTRIRSSECYGLSRFYSSVACGQGTRSSVRISLFVSCTVTITISRLPIVWSIVTDFIWDNRSIMSRFEPIVECHHSSISVSRSCWGVYHSISTSCNIIVGTCCFWCKQRIDHNF